MFHPDAIKADFRSSAAFLDARFPGDGIFRMGVKCFWILESFFLRKKPPSSDRLVSPQIRKMLQGACARNATVTGNSALKIFPLAILSFSTKSQKLHHLGSQPHEKK